MSPGKVETIRRGYDAFNHGDFSPVKNMVTPDVEWRTIGVAPGIPSVYRGLRGMEEWMHLFRSVWAFFDVSLVEVVEETEHAVIVMEHLRGRGQEDGAELRRSIFAVYWFDAGKVRRRRSFTTREEALDAAGIRA